MSVFIALAVLGVAVAAGILLPRLLGRHVDAAAAAEVATADNIAAGREQMRILRSRAAAGEISGDEYEEYSREIEEQLARDLEQARAISTGQVKADDSGSRDWSGAAIVVTTLVLVPTIMYLIVGSPQLIDEDRSTPAVAGAAPGMDEIEQRLRRMLAENPDESESHYWLGKVLASQGRSTEAAESFARARAISGNTPDLLASEAAALMDADMAGNAKGIDWLIEAGLEMDAQDTSLLWLAGLNAEHKGDSAAALSYWEKAQALIGEDDEESARQIAAVIADARQRLGGSAEPGPGQLAPVEAADAAPVEATHAGVKVQVQLANPDDARPPVVLFVFARSETPGPPLAVYRREVASYPLTVVLDDRLAMMPARKMSDFPSYTIVARLSRTGQATASSGDRYGEVAGVEPGQSVTVVIDSTVP